MGYWLQPLKIRAGRDHIAPTIGVGQVQYKFTDDANYEDYAAGRVILGHKGATAFPVRLASEIFLRCLAYREEPSPVRIYDPCGGGAYLLTVLGFLHGDQIESLRCSDIRLEAIQLAQDNLALLSVDGLQKRAEMLREYAERYQKDSHQAALESIARLEAQLPQTPIPTFAYVADALTCTVAPASVDVMIADIPYGNVAAWQTDADDPITKLLDAQYNALAANAIAVIITLKEQKIEHPRYDRLKHETLGKRRITFLRPQMKSHS